MAYNFCLKKYANGTLQLTYYDSPILQDCDKYIELSEDLEADILRGYEDDSDLYNPWGCAENVIEEDMKSDETISTIECSNNVVKDRERSINVSLNRSVHKIYDYGRNNVWEWFFTFTLSDANIDRYDYKECSQKVRQWLNNIKKRKCPEMKYLVVPEQHKSGAWHFHALVSNVDSLTFEVAINQQEYRKNNDGSIKYNKKGQPVPNKYFGQYLRTSYPDGDYIYNISEYKNGWSTATKIKDTKKAVSYIVKYITKDLAECTFGLRRFYPSNNLLIPERITGLSEKKNLQEIILDIEYTFGVKLSKDYIKTVNIFCDSYKNTISYLEFE